MFWMFTSVRGNVTLILLSFLMNMYHHDSSLGFEAPILSSDILSLWTCISKVNSVSYYILTYFCLLIVTPLSVVMFNENILSSHVKPNPYLQQQHSLRKEASNVAHHWTLTTSHFEWLLFLFIIQTIAKSSL